MAPQSAGLWAWRAGIEERYHGLTCGNHAARLGTGLEILLALLTLVLLTRLLLAQRRAARP